MDELDQCAEALKNIVQTLQDLTKIVRYLDQDQPDPVAVYLETVCGEIRRKSAQCVQVLEYYNAPDVLLN
jgi:hypothetical protein